MALTNGSDFRGIILQAVGNEGEEPRDAALVDNKAAPWGPYVTEFLERFP